MLVLWIGTGVVPKEVGILCKGSKIESDFDYAKDGGRSHCLWPDYSIGEIDNMCKACENLGIDFRIEHY